MDALSQSLYSMMEWEKGNQESGDLCFSPSSARCLGSLLQLIYLSGSKLPSGIGPGGF